MNQAQLYFTVRPMVETDARAILNWRYETPYDFYNAGSVNPDEALKEMLDGSHYAVFDVRGSLAGFFAFGPTATVPGGTKFGLYTDDALDIGLGMRPGLTGCGLGLSFVRAGVDFARKNLGASALRLSVATFNRRAIVVYQRAGFNSGPIFPSATSGDGVTEFLLMTLASVNDAETTGKGARL
ncbi:MAG: GNAT family N-acetyltransferase [Chloroflexota bacterium]|nr:GNAT family N-acetyltransferase [Chloroflexota bacterium]